MVLVCVHEFFSVSMFCQTATEHQTDRNSPFKCRALTHDKSTVKRRFRARATATLKSRLSILFQNDGSHSESVVTIRTHSPASDRASVTQGASALGAASTSTWTSTWTLTWTSSVSALSCVDQLRFQPLARKVTSQPCPHALRFFVATCCNERFVEAHALVAVLNLHVFDRLLLDSVALLRGRRVGNRGQAPCSSEAEIFNTAALAFEECWRKLCVSSIARQSCLTHMPQT